MNHEDFTEAGRRTARTNERRVGPDGAVRGTVGRAATLAVRVLAYLVAGLALAWVGMFAVPALGGLLAATVVGLGVVWLVPWLVVAGVVHVLAAVE